MAPTMEPSTAVAHLGDVALHYAVRGDDGPWVTLIHGGLMASAGWEDQARRLSDTARVLTFDLRGYGASSKPPNGYTVEQFAADLLRLWDLLGVQRSAVVGFSMGGFVAIDTALAAPQRVTGLLLVGTAATLPEAARAGFRRRADELERTGTEAERAAHIDRVFSAGFRAANPAFMREYHRVVAQNDPLCLAATFRGLADFDRAADVGRIDCPVIVACGEDDAAIPLEHSKALHQALPRSRLVTVSATGHTFHAERPEQFAELVRVLMATVAPTLA